jgi:hypothetical protein
MWTPTVDSHSSTGYGLIQIVHIERSDGWPWKGKGKEFFAPLSNNLLTALTPQNG